MQVAVDPVPERVQSPLNVPVLLVPREKLPVGAIGVPGEMSVTLTLQTELAATVTGLVQETVTDTLRTPTRMT